MPLSATSIGSAVFAVVCLFGPNTAAAQWDAYMNMNVGDSGLFQPIVHQDFSRDYGSGRRLTDVGRSVYGRSSAGAARNPQAARLDPRALRFERSSTVSREVQREVIDTLAKAAPERRAELIDGFQRTDAVGEFSRMIENYGYDPNNFAHVMTAFLIIQWEVSTGRTADAAQMRGSAQQVETALLTGDLLTRMSNADKQTVAESMAYQASLSAALQNDLRRRSAHQQLIALRRGVLEGTRKIGWDFDQVELTADGFVARR